MGILPLHKNARAILQNTNISQGNAGLLYNKYCNTWVESEETYLTMSSNRNNNPKSAWISKFAHPQGDDILLREAHARRQQLAHETHGMSLTFVTQAALITGMGHPHPVENGFTWHHTLATAYIPGSSVKGLVRDWVKNWLSDQEELLWKNAEEKNQLIFRIFGSEEKSNQAQKTVGSVIFLDALPTKPVKLKTEIMTPHYGDYYQDKTGNTAPGDWLTPTPIPFLAVDKDQTFEFIILPRHTHSARESDNIILHAVKEWLTRALQYLGAGAKTAGGYGIMKSEESIEKEKEQQQLNLDKELDLRANEWLHNTIEGFRADNGFKKKPGEKPEENPEKNLWKKRLSEELPFAPSDIQLKVLALIKLKWEKLEINWDRPQDKNARKAKTNFNKIEARLKK